MGRWEGTKKQQQKENLYMGQNIMRKMSVYISDFWLLRKMSQGQGWFTYWFVLVF